MKNNGFTLIETILVFALMGVLILFVVPKIPTDFGYMDKMAEEFLNDARFIQMESMKYPKPIYQIYVHPNDRKYLLMNEYITIKEVNFNERYSINYTGMGGLRFNNDGTPINAGTFTIKDNKTNKVKSVTIVPTTGRTIIVE